MDRDHALASSWAPNDDVRATLPDLNAPCALDDPHHVASRHVSSILDEYAAHEPLLCAVNAEPKVCGTLLNAPVM